MDLQQWHDHMGWARKLEEKEGSVNHLAYAHDPNIMDLWIERLTAIYPDRVFYRTASATNGWQLLWNWGATYGKKRMGKGKKYVKV